MGVTIATHNGSQLSQGHNRRDENIVSKEAHIDPNGRHETWVDSDLLTAYRQLFAEAIGEYNAKQKRKDRMKSVEGYLKECTPSPNKAEQNKADKKPAYEMIIGIYGKDENGKAICDPDTAYKILARFVEGWPERNPNLMLIGAYYHADEPGAEPHVHLDYVPVARNLTRGLSVQNSLTKALEQQGTREVNGEIIHLFKTEGIHDTAQMQWEARENHVLESLCKEYGLEVDHPRGGSRHEQTRTLKETTAIKERVQAEAAQTIEAANTYAAKARQEADAYAERAAEGLRRREASVKDRETNADRYIEQRAAEKAEALAEPIAERKAIAMFKDWRRTFDETLVQTGVGRLFEAVHSFLDQFTVQGESMYEMFRRENPEICRRLDPREEDFRRDTKQAAEMVDYEER